MTLAIIALSIWGCVSVLALALAKANGTTEEERNDPGEPVTLREVFRV